MADAYRVRRSSISTRSLRYLSDWSTLISLRPGLGPPRPARAHLGRVRAAHEDSPLAACLLVEPIPRFNEVIRRGDRGHEGQTVLDDLAAVFDWNAGHGVRHKDHPVRTVDRVEHEVRYGEIQ